MGIERSARYAEDCEGVYQSDLVIWNSSLHSHIHFYRWNAKSVGLTKFLRLFHWVLPVHGLIIGLLPSSLWESPIWHPKILSPTFRFQIYGRSAHNRKAPFYLSSSWNFLCKPVFATVLKRKSYIVFYIPKSSIGYPANRTACCLCL